VQARVAVAVAVAVVAVVARAVVAARAAAAQEVAEEAQGAAEGPVPAGRSDPQPMSSCQWRKWGLTQRFPLGGPPEQAQKPGP
jgi:hypothetical protein